MHNIAMFFCNLPAWVFAFAAHGCMSVEAIRKRLVYAPLVFLVPAAVLLLMSKSFFAGATLATLGVYGVVFLLSFVVNYSLARRFGIPTVDRGCEWKLDMPVVMIVVIGLGVFSYIYTMLPQDMYAMKSEIGMNASMLGYFLSQACAYIVRGNKTK